MISVLSAVAEIELIFFDKLYAQMNEAEKREFLSQLVDNVQIYEERKENGQWLKSIEFKLPIIEKEFTLSLDNDTQNETVVLLSKGAKGPVDLCLAQTEAERRQPQCTPEKEDAIMQAFRHFGIIQIVDKQHYVLKIQ